MKKLLALCLLIFTSVYVQAQTLTWDIKFFKTATWETIPIDQTINLKSGEEFAISITPASDCFAYIVVYDSEENISVEYHGLSKGEDEIICRFELEGKAVTDTFYIIMSLTRQTSLENLIQAFDRNPNDRRNKNNLYSEVVRLQRTTSGLGEPAISIIATATTSRTVNQNAPEYTTRFSGKNIYVRRITISH